MSNGTDTSVIILRSMPSNNERSVVHVINDTYSNQSGSNTSVVIRNDCVSLESGMRRMRDDQSNISGQSYITIKKMDSNSEMTDKSYLEI